jgi:hypothetical protein
MLTVTTVLEALWKEMDSREEREAMDWMRERLSGDYYVFDGEKDIRQWALDNTDLEEPAD